MLILASKVKHKRTLFLLIICTLLFLIDSRRNKPPVPRKPAHLSPKLNNRLGAKPSGPVTANRSPKKTPLTAAVSTGSTVTTRRVTNLSDDQRTYDQVCYEPPDDFDPPQPKSKNLERFFGMKPEMAKPITSIKPCSDDFLRGNNAIPLRSPGRGQPNTEEGEHYAVVDLPDRTSLKKKDKKQKNSSSGLTPNKSDAKRISSGGNSGDSGIHIVLPDDASQRDSPRGMYQGHGGSMNSSISSSDNDSDYSDHGEIEDLVSPSLECNKDCWFWLTQGSVTWLILIWQRKFDLFVKYNHF